MRASRQQPYSSALRSVLIAAVAVAVGVHTGLGVTTGGGKALAILPLVGVVGAALLMIARSDFGVFAMVLIAARPVIDAARLSDAESVANPSSLVAIAFLVLGCLWLLRNPRTDSTRRRSALGAAIAAFLVASALSVIGSAHPVRSLQELVRMTSGFTMFFVVERLLSRGLGLASLVRALLGSAVVPVAVGLLAGPALSEEKDGVTRLTSTFVQSNPLGYYLMGTLILGMAVFFAVDRRWKAQLAILGAGAAVLLILTYTLGALIGLVVGSLVLGMLYQPRILSVLLIAAAVAFVASPTLVTRFTDLGGGSATSVAPRETENSLEWRVTHWERVVGLANENPITGVGLQETKVRTEQGKLPHNDYLRAYVESGVLGISSFVALLVSMVWTGLRARRRAATPLQRAVANAFLAYACAYVVVSAGDNLTNQVVLLWFFCGFAAVAASIASSPGPGDSTVITGPGGRRGGVRLQGAGSAQLSGTGT